MLKRSIPPRRRCNPTVRTIKGILQRRYVSPKGEKGEPSLCNLGEGHGRGEESGEAASKDSPAYGERNVETVGGGTREISYSRGLTSFVTSGISTRAKSGGMLYEKSDEVIVLLMV